MQTDLGEEPTLLEIAMKRLALAACCAALLVPGCRDAESPEREETPADPEEPGDEPAVPEAPADEPAAGDDEGPAPADDVEVVPLQHGSFFLEWSGGRIAVDPVTSALEATPRPEAEAEADLIVLTDIHGDHLDPAAVKKLRREGTPVVAPEAVVKKAGDALPDATVMANGDTKTLLDGAVHIEATPMYNIERKTDAGEPFHVKGRGNGYVLTLDETRVYISGDTECTPEMKALEDIHIALVTMNLPYTMPVEEAAECIREFRPDVVYPFHYRGQDVSKLEELLADVPETEVRLLEWYPGGD